MNHMKYKIINVECKKKKRNKILYLEINIYSVKGLNPF